MIAGGLERIIRLMQIIIFRYLVCLTTNGKPRRVSDVMTFLLFRVEVTRK